ncbi:GuaB1 family IMP dehydrogenase-related protein [Candidatus Saccharibacteria bacterium]|nr:GuaB1 family IMP dehydrogenase-related protein [Candidatus Saccharibacteria bacterium]
MKFLNDISPKYDLTYSDVFLVPQKASINSRFDVDLSTNDGTGNTIPIVVANMMAVAGKRMAETVARRGGLVVLPQDIPYKILEKTIASVKSCHVQFETPVTLSPEHTIRDAMSLIHKRAHGAVIIVNDNQEPVGIFTQEDAVGRDMFDTLEKVSSMRVECLDGALSSQQMFEELVSKHLRVAPVTSNKKLVGIVTAKGALRTEIYTPNLDLQGKLKVAVAIGINGDVATKAQQVAALGADILVLDTAHGHQTKMIEAIKAVRSALPGMVLVAGNVVTAEATNELLQAGANIVKVGVGPGAMCTTRMMTGVGRPQFSAVLECSAEAAKHGGFVWADGGVRHPRDVALALAAGASNVMFASWFAGTYESAADTQTDNTGRLFKENYGMASRRAVKSRQSDSSAFEMAKKELFEEGISTSRMYVNEEMPGVEDIIDHIVAGVRSACTYEGATTLGDFCQKSVVGMQSAAGFQEGAPTRTSW